MKVTTVRPWLPGEPNKQNLTAPTRLVCRADWPGGPVSAAGLFVCCVPPELSGQPSVLALLRCLVVQRPFLLKKKMADRCTWGTSEDYPLRIVFGSSDMTVDADCETADTARWESETRVLSLLKVKASKTKSETNNNNKSDNKQAMQSKLFEPASPQNINSCICIKQSINQSINLHGYPPSSSSVKQTQSSRDGFQLLLQNVKLKLVEDWSVFSFLTSQVWNDHHHDSWMAWLSSRLEPPPLPRLVPHSLTEHIDARPRRRIDPVMTVLHKSNSLSPHASRVS